MSNKDIAMTEQQAPTPEQLIAKLEAYGFECQAGYLVNCVDWRALRQLVAPHRRCFAAGCPTCGNFDTPAAKNIDTAFPSDSERIRQLETALERAIALATPQPSPTGPDEAQAHVMHFVDVLSETLLKHPSRNSSPVVAAREAVVEALDGALSQRRAPETATPSLPLQEPADCGRCKGSGHVTVSTTQFGPDDYDVDVECPLCNGSGAAPSLPAVLTDAQIEAGRVVLKNYAAGDLMAAEAIRDIIRALATSATPVLP